MKRLQSGSLNRLWHHNCRGRRITQVHPGGTVCRKFSDKSDIPRERGALEGIRVLDFSRILAVRLPLVHKEKDLVERLSDCRLPFVPKS